jgi:DNA helicase II / ATP-dependent DNA helicase PcrA
MHIAGTEWLSAAAEAFSEILVKEEYFSTAEGEAFARSADEMIADMRKNRVDIENLTIEDLGIYASPTDALKLLTLHQAKGREYSAVAMMDLHEGRIPNYRAKKTHEIEEGKRLFYVGVTRAKRYLLFITDDSGRNGPTRFLRELELA